MSQEWRLACLAAVALLGWLAPARARGDIVIAGGFGPNGDLGFVTSPSSLAITFGGTGSGSIAQMDGYLNVPGTDFQSIVGASADLGNGAPTGFGYGFAASQPTSHQLLLSYRFVNNTGAAVAGLQFLQFTDADIGSGYVPSDYATVNGSTGLSGPTSFQVGDPQFSTIFTNLGAGSLSNFNELAGGSSTGDVSIGLGFTLGRWAPARPSPSTSCSPTTGRRWAGSRSASKTPTIPRTR